MQIPYVLFSRTLHPTPSTLGLWYCGVFTPCKNCNIETRSHDYETVDEAVFSPWRALTSRASLRIASARLLLGNSYKYLDEARVRKGHVTALAVTSRASTGRNNWSVSRVSDQEFIGETEARSGVVIGQFLGGRLQSVLGSRRRGMFIVTAKNWRVNRRTDLCIIFGVWDCGSFCVESRC
jgi:hypothetical protein